MKRLLHALRWAMYGDGGAGSAGALTVHEIRDHVQALRARRERLTARSMALSSEIAYWSAEIRRRRAPVGQSSDLDE